MTAFAYRVATGHISVVTIEGSSSYLLSNRSITSDQPTGVPWSVAEYPKINIYRRTKLNGKFAVQGYFSFTLFLSGMTPGMMDSWDDDFFSSGAVESKEFTCQIPDKRLIEASEKKTFQGIIHRPTPDQYAWVKRIVPVAINIPYLVTQAALIT